MSTDAQPNEQEIAEFHSRLPNTDYFQLLGVHKDSTPGAIKSSFHALARRWHVDNFPKLKGTPRAQVEAIAQALNSAYETLSDPTLLKEYAVFCERKQAGLATDVNQVLRAEQLVDEAVVEIKRKQWSSAREKLQEAIRLNPDDALYHVHLAWAEYHEHPKAPATVNAALNRLDEATDRQENLPLAYEYGGHICFQLGDYAAAKHRWKRCLSWQKNNIVAARGLRLITSRQEKEANSLLGRVRGFFGLK